MRVIKWIILYILLPGNLFLVSCDKKKETLFSKLSSDHSGVTFENTIVETPEINILTYEYAYNGGGVAAADFNNDGLCDLYFSGNTVKNRLYLNKGNLQFEDITDKANVAGRSLWKTGVTVADVNADGWLDIYVCYSGPDASHSLSNELYINNGGQVGAEPTFHEEGKLYGLDAPDTYSTQASFFDYDRDGDLDMFLINHGNHFYSPFINTNKLRNTRHPNFGNRLYRNNTIAGTDFDKKSNPVFTEVSQEAGIHGGGINFSLGVSISDVNNDGWPDIYVTNDYEEQDFLYLNRKNGTFKEVTKNSFGHLSRNGMGTDLADYNNDGKTDLIELDMWPEDNYRQKLLKGPDDYHRYTLMTDSGFHLQQMRNTLQLNTGNDSDGAPQFSEIGQLAGVSSTDWSWAPLFMDVDNDGHKDLFVSNGYLRDFTSMDFLKFTVEEAKKEASRKGESLQLYQLLSKMSSTKTSDYLFKNNGDLTFSDFSKAWGIFQPNLSFGATYADLDNDGDLEIITNNTNEPATIWKNNSSEEKLNSHLRIKLVGPKENPFAIGAKIYVDSDSLHQFQELILTRGFQSSVDPVVHFGLGSGKKANKIRVVWPDGKETNLKDQLVDGTIEIAYANANAVNEIPTIIAAPIFVDVSNESKIDFIHHENEFVDFDREPLIPYQLSRMGPALAKGDVNGDGNDDFYIGGAAGQKSVLFLASGNGQFMHASAQPWDADAASEDTGATFFDADGDHDLDLFVVSGGNELDADSPALADRLYINIGSGNFVRSKAESTPNDRSSGSCVVAADYDKDGDLDLFVGGRSVPGRFPLTSPSAILRNESDLKNGIIKFVVATQDVNASLREPGIVTDAIWCDYNNDGWSDLVVVGEWMPIRVFENNKGKLTEVVNNGLENSAGLWNIIVPADIDHDGDLDFVIGNSGTNLPWHASPQEPLSLYFGDFDGDGRVDPIVCNFNGGRNYPVASRDEMLLQMNSFRKKYESYSSYGAATLEELIGKEQMKNSKKYEVKTLSTSVLENKGNNQFGLKALPLQAQFSSVRAIVSDDFNGDGFSDILLAGNFSPWRTQYGPSDAGKGLLLYGNKNGIGAASDWITTGFNASGDIRNMVLLKTKSGKEYVVVGKNNSSTKVFELKK